MLALDRLNIIKRPVRQNSSLGWFSAYDGNLLGGLMVGLGMGLSGACPGAVLVQLAHGIPSAKAAAIGALLGGGAYVRVTQRKLQQPEGKAATSKCTISDISKIPEPMLYALLGPMIAGIVSLSHTGGSTPAMSPVVGGLAIGFAQATTLLLTASPLGVSTVYEQLGRYILRALGNEKVGKPASPPKSISFALGMIAGSIALAKQFPIVNVAETDFQVPFWQALVGGFVMAFGARLAGGCTAGHGLSGLGALSFSSLVTAMGMFGAGILTRQLM